MDDGIEGEIFGFNMVLSSTTEAGNHRYNERQETRHHYRAARPDDEEITHSDYIRLGDLNDEEEPENQTTRLNFSPIVFPQLPTSEHRPKSIDSNKLRIVTDNYYNIDEDYMPYVAHKAKKNKDTRNINTDHVIAIKYFPDAPGSDDFSEEEEDEDSEDDEEEEDVYFSDTPSDLLRPPAPTWRHAQSNKGIEEQQTLALTNLPIYQTPPALPAPDVSMKPSFEVLYSRNNFKGNEWYDQNNYFPTELFRHLKYRVPQRESVKAHYRHQQQKRNRQYHAHAHANGQKQKHAHPHPHRGSSYVPSDLYPYPSSQHDVYRPFSPSIHIMKKRDETNHTVVRRDLSGGEKNIQILNPESIIVYPTGNEVVNVEVFPRSGSSAEEEYDDDDSQSGDEPHTNTNEYTRVIIALDNNNRLQNHRLNYDDPISAQSEVSIDPYTNNLKNNKDDNEKMSEDNSPNPSYEVLYSQIHYKGNKQQRKIPPKIEDGNYFKYAFNDSESGHYNQGESFSPQYYSVKKSAAPEVEIPDESERLNNMEYNQFTLNRQEPRSRLQAQRDERNTVRRPFNNPPDPKINLQYVRVINKDIDNQHINRLNPYKQLEQESVRSSINTRFPENIRDKINDGESDYVPMLTDASIKGKHSQFDKPVKLGNALNEKQIFKEHGNSRETSFVNSDDRVPDIAHYRSDIDDREGINFVGTGRTNSRFVPTKMQRKISSRGDRQEAKSTGYKLVELSYRKCLIERGSPLALDSLSLVSWTNTPVKMFGGAKLRQAHPMCGSF